jgi:hybrid cluster-associated redox disulfide protein
MPDDSPITSDMSVDDVLSAYPQTAAVFVAHAMACVGCMLSPFHSLAEAARTYHLELDTFLDELRNNIAPKDRPPSA